MAQPFNSRLSLKPSLWHPVLNWLLMVLSDRPRSSAIVSGDLAHRMNMDMTSNSVLVSLLPSARAATVLQQLFYRFIL